MKHYCNAKTSRGTKCKMVVYGAGRRCPYHKYKPTFTKSLKKTMKKSMKK